MPPPRPGPRHALLVLGLIAAVIGIGWLLTRPGGAPGRPTDPEAVALYQRGLRAFARRTPGGAAEAVSAFGAAVASWRGKHQVAGGVLIGAALVPALFAASSLVFTFFLLVAGGLSFAVKPGMSSPQELFDRYRRKVTA